MECQEIKYNNAKVRVHFPDNRTKEEQTEIVKKATEKFVKKVLYGTKERR